MFPFQSQALVNMLSYMAKEILQVLLSLKLWDGEIPDHPGGSNVI